MLKVVNLESKREEITSNDILASAKDQYSDVILIGINYDEEEYPQLSTCSSSGVPDPTILNWYLDQVKLFLLTGEL